MASAIMRGGSWHLPAVEPLPVSWGHSAPWRQRQSRQGPNRRTPSRHSIRMCAGLPAEAGQEGSGAAGCGGRRGCALPVHAADRPPALQLRRGSPAGAGAFRVYTSQFILQGSVLRVTHGSLPSQRPQPLMQHLLSLAAVAMVVVVTGAQMVVMLVVMAMLMGMHMGCGYGFRLDCWCSRWSWCGCTSTCAHGRRRSRCSAHDHHQAQPHTPNPIAHACGHRLWCRGWTARTRASGGRARQQCTGCWWWMPRAA